MSIDRVNALTQEQRDAALHQARLRMVGPEPEPGREPTLDDFLARGTGKLPVGVTLTIRRLSVIALLATFFPSATRLHQIGLESFGQAVTDVTTAYVAALCIVLMAEVGQIIFSLAAVTAERGTGRINWQRMGLHLGAMICTAIALSGNAEVVKPWLHAGVFIWFETFAPPFLVLITANILKSQMLHSIEDLHRARMQFEAAHAEWVRDGQIRKQAWQNAYAQAHEQADWMRVVANALRDALRSANRRSYAMVRELSDADWRELVLRELKADQWYVRAEAQAQEHARIEQAQTQAEARTAGVHAHASSSGQRTGETAGQVRFDDARGVWVSECPHCGSVYAKDSERGAVNSLAAHMRFCKVRNVSETAMRAQYANAVEMVEVGTNGQRR